MGLGVERRWLGVVLWMLDQVWNDGPGSCRVEILDSSLCSE